MPILGFGTYQLLGDKARLALDQALMVGYKHIDTAFSYNNGREISDVITERIKAGKLKRKDIFLTTKVPPVYLDPQDVSLCVEESLDILKSQYIDLLLIHNPWALKNHGDGNLKPKNKNDELEFRHIDLVRIWRGMESVFRTSRVKSIGLSNCTTEQIENIWNAAKIKPSNLQLECHAYLQQKNIAKYCTFRGIVLTAYSPLGHLTQSKQFQDKPVLLEDKTIDVIAKTYRKTPAQILLRFLLQRGFSVIPKSQSYNRLVENFNVFDFNICQDDIKRIEGLDKGVKCFTFLQYEGHPEFSANSEF